jgi:hypothetical protein
MIATPAKAATNAPIAEAKEPIDLGMPIRSTQ